MFTLSRATVTLAFLIVHAAAANQPSKDAIRDGGLVDVTVMIESYCPCSGAFSAAFQEFVSLKVGNLVNLDRIFDAGSKGTQGCCNPSADVDTATCMHGLTECTADRLQACAQKLYPEWRDWLGYTVCIAGNCDNRPDAMGCKSQFIVGKDENRDREVKCANNMTFVMDDINDCWNGPDGVQAMQMNADRSDDFGQAVYGLDGLPAVWVEGEIFGSFFDCDGSSDKYVSSLTAKICEVYQQKNPGSGVPSGCE